MPPRLAKILRQRYTGVMVRPLFTKNERPLLLCVFTAICVFASLGLNWGLPSRERTRRLFPHVPSHAVNMKLAENHVRNLRLQYGPKPHDQKGVIDKKITIDPWGIGDPPEILGWSLAGVLALSQEHDEMHSLIACRQAYPGRPGFDAHWHLYGGGYSYPLSILLKLVRYLLVRGDPDSLLSAFDPHELRWLFLGGRLMSVAALLICAVLCFLIARVLGLTGSDGAYICLLFAISPAVIAQAHLMKPHLWSAMFGLLFIWVLLRARKVQRFSNIFLGGLFLGFAIGSGVYNLLLIFLPFVFFLRREMRAAGLGGMLFIAGSATLCLNSGLWRDVLRGGGPIQDALGFYIPRLNGADNFWFLIKSFFGGLGPPVAFMSAVGMLAAWRRAGDDDPRRPLILYIIAACGVSAVVFAGQGIKESRFMLVPFALAVMYIPQGVRWCSERIRFMKQTPVIVVLILSQTLLAGAMDVNFIIAGTRYSNAAKAARWIQRHFPPGAEIGITQPVPTADTFPVFKWNQYKFVYIPNMVSDAYGEDGDGPSVILHNPRSAWGKPAKLKQRYPRIISFEGQSAFEFFNRQTNANFPVHLYMREGPGAR